MVYKKRRIGFGSGISAAANLLWKKYSARHGFKKTTRFNARRKLRMRRKTLTKTKTKVKQRSTDNDQHSGLGNRRIVLVLNKPLKGKGIARWKFIQNHATIITGNSGNQVATVVGGIAHRNNFTTATALPNVLETRVALFSLNNDRIVSGSAVFGSQTPATDRMCIYNVRTHMMFTNLESIASTMYLYFVTPKKDSPKYVDTLWSSTLTAEGLGLANRTRAGAGTYGGTAAGTAFVTDVFQKPFDVHEVNEYYRQLKVIKINLAAGASEEVIITSYINRIVSLLRLNDAGTSESIKGLSIQVLCVAYSQPVHDTTGGGTNCTTGSVRIGMVSTSTYHCGLTKAVASARADDMVTHQQIADNVLVANQATIDINDAVAAVDQA